MSTKKVNNDTKDVFIERKETRKSKDFVINLKRNKDRWKKY